MIRDLIARIVHGIARRLGYCGRRWAWNSLFRRGASFSLDRSPVTVGLVERLARRGIIVELACGDGMLSRCINSSCYSAYRGYDISDAAIELAKKASNMKCEFSVCDMIKWREDDKVDLIVIEEALYYLTHTQQRHLLRRCAETLKSDGRILVIVHSEVRHADTIGICSEVLAVDELVKEGDRRHLILRPK